MKKLSLLLTLLCLMLVSIGAQASTEKISLTFANDEAHGITWNANTCTVDGFKVTFTNGNANKPYWSFANPVSVKDCSFTITARTAELTFEFIDVNNKAAFYHSFGKEAVTMNDFAHIDNGQGADLTKIKQINLDPRTTDKDVSITFSAITITLDNSYDEVISIPSYTKTIEFKVTDGEFNAKYTGESNSINTETGALYLGANSSAAWDKYYANPRYDLSGSDIFVVKLKEAATQDLLVMINQNGFWETVGEDATKENNGLGYVGTLKKGDSELVINLNNLKSNRTVHNGTALDLTKIGMINLWSGVADAATYYIDEVYAAKKSTSKYYLVRQNTTASKYGTICLPFSASKPSNADVYTVVGCDDSNVYLKGADNIEAGKAYLFMSTDANDITFTKTGTEENLTAAESATSGLIGTFAEATIPEGGYLLHDGSWYKTNGNKVGAYRAYLTLSDDLKVATAPASAKAMSINGDGHATGINSVEKTVDANAPAYNLAGQRVDKNYKGVVIKNGKKYIVK